MSLYQALLHRHAADKPIRLGLIVAGKFGSMFLAQALKLKGIQIIAIADLSVSAARSNLQLVGWPEEALQARSADEARQSGQIYLTEDVDELISCPFIDIIIEATGNPISAVDHIVASFAQNKHVINVTVEADAFCGAGLAKRAEEYRVLYSLAYGDQPALTAELVDWARCCGFQVMAAGRGHIWQPEYRLSTPETVWEHWGLSKEQAERGRLNPKMFNAFLDGSKPAIESAAIANACGLNVPETGLSYPAGTIDEIPQLMRPKQDGGVLEKAGMVEVISSLKPDGSHVGYDIRKGVWVCLQADTDYIKTCFEEYKVVTDDTGQYCALYKRWHLIGLELGMSVAQIGIRGEATGTPAQFIGDVSAAAKGRLEAGTILDGEGGSTVYGALRPAVLSVQKHYLPLGLCTGARLKRAVECDEILTWDDVELDTTALAFRLREETVALSNPGPAHRSDSPEPAALYSRLKKGQPLA